MDRHRLISLDRDGGRCSSIGNFDRGIWARSNVHLTQHLAGAQGNELPRLGESVVREVEALAAGRPAVHPYGIADLEKSA